MTYSEALANGYKRAFVSYQKGYVSRKIDPHNQPLIEGKGIRKGMYYVELPCWISTRYSFRLYLTKP